MPINLGISQAYGVLRVQINSFDLRKHQQRYKVSESWYGSEMLVCCFLAIVKVG